MEDEAKPFLKGNLYKYGAKKTAIVFDKLDISKEENFCHQLYIFYCNLNQDSGLRHSIKSSLIAL